ncbi:mycofactocin-coupled SDR family oxidoreductase [Nocardioides sp. zg-579]|uniref:Mycofactocin-coupled SDR family oxidoreductase n=1 Tax=Nocardioides marmotae TaxID=2663857 RepID=A0A6I3IYI5_9ACTN|nr:mycofactocin-coupled SDR family oxidoreductase [Nocardioides marmotae]MCR6030100.1 mycofactocin-coupled SDR family oxidoreductase [Gordonia jinghuaiqii]MTB93731.1 mycofactocin-coupled SDR family oxidoreductase [Nocardioides marmotae]QKE00074.1 mycofactocin-coupled SDR family oxidoreductase [Nocardioides marmotae]
MTGRVEGKVAFITGAARGQGRAHAVRLAEEGADIIAMDLLEPLEHVRYPGSSKEDMDETVRLVEATGRRIVARQGDVRSLESVREVVDEGVIAMGGRLDIVCANAGIMILHEWSEGTPELWDATIATNLTGVWNTVMATAQHLIDAGGGSMILTSSSAGLRGQPFLNPYVAAKHGVVGVMRAFAVELAEYGIRVNTIHPTGVNTTMIEGLGDAYPTFLEHHPSLALVAKNLLDVPAVEATDLAQAVVYLASDESRYVTATTLTVDAGITQH